MKPGHKTTEFWLVAITIATAALESVRGSVSGTAAIVVAGSLAGLYAAMRTLAKVKAK